MVKRIHMKNDTKGFYTLEAAIFLPIVILAVLSLGYFMRVIGTWENCVHGAVDESMLAASKSYDGTSAYMAGRNVSERVIEDNPQVDEMKVKNLRVMYRDIYADDITSFNLYCVMKLELPLGFSREFVLDYGIKYRGFTGTLEKPDPMGVSGLESYAQQQPVWVFPHSGEKYHKEGCTHVKASAEPTVLTSAVRKKYNSCSTCDSASMTTGSIVFCFKGEDTAFHRSTCSTIVKHTMIMDKSEALKKGYTPCTKCGGS
ncbi:MAG: hypothetical protein Q4B18_03630 [Bacillota bacterium]|nr:hypothetical protein [Bacillota bacterium]